MNLWFVQLSLVFQFSVLVLFVVVFVASVLVVTARKTRQKMS